MHDAELSVHGTLEEEGWESQPVFCEFGRKKENQGGGAVLARLSSNQRRDHGPRRDGARTKHIHTQIPCVSGVFRFAETLSSSELGGLAHFENARRGGRGTRARSNTAILDQSGTEGGHGDNTCVQPSGLGARLGVREWVGQRRR